ncbi:hypothetical protein WJX81_007822 [Elliptochloris bilobata]|uniref:Peroxisome biogenesis protein 22 n=1 Tax=Elliptochloris bilobata TaxID=381761 RepID=A0AAW1RWT4_9CHLO
MEVVLRELRSLCHSLLTRLSHLFRDYPPGTLQLTGVLGLAAVLYGIYAVRNGRKPPGEAGSEDSAATAAADASRSGNGAGPAGQALAGPDPPARSWAATQPAQAPARATGAATSRAVRAALAGVKVVTLSAPGVLLEEWDAAALQDAATLRPEAAAVAREVARAARVYVIAHVADDVGEATVRGACEAGGLVGDAHYQVPAHRLLFCSTLEGKVSMVRQLEPELHIDGDPQTVEDLKRFMPQLLHIVRPGVRAAASRFPNVGSAASLAAAFGAS